MHLALEKILKALFVQNERKFAPLSHNLLSLAGKSGLVMSAAQEIQLAEFNEFSLEARYPDDRDEFLKKATRLYSENALHTCRELYTWISEHLDP